MKVYNSMPELIYNTYITIGGRVYPKSNDTISRKDLIIAFSIYKPKKQHKRKNN